MQTTTKKKYQCYLCKKEYIRKSCFDTHVVYCELLSKSKREREQALEQELETPSPRNMYLMIQQLVRENEKMKSEITALKKAMNLNNIKVTLSDWLRDNCKPNTDFDDWFKLIKINQEDIEFIFNENVSNCLVQLFIRNLSVINTEINCVQCFTEKNNTLFISVKQTDESAKVEETDESSEVKEEGKIIWTPITIQTFKKYLVQLQKKLITGLITWKENCDDEISNVNSDINDKYIKIMQQIISINQKHENRIANFVIKNIYEQLKTSLPSNVVVKKTAT